MAISLEEQGLASRGPGGKLAGAPRSVGPELN